MCLTCSKLPYDVDPEEALKHPEVRTKVEAGHEQANCCYREVPAEYCSKCRQDTVSIACMVLSCVIVRNFGEGDCGDHGGDDVKRRGGHHHHYVGISCWMLATRVLHLVLFCAALIHRT